MSFKRYRITLLLIALVTLLVASLVQFTGNLQSGTSGANTRHNPLALIASSKSEALREAPEAATGEGANITARSTSAWHQLTYPAGYLPAQVMPQALAWRNLHNPEVQPAGLSGMPANKITNPNSPIPLVPGQWTSLGPQPIVGGAASDAGRVTAITVDPTNAAIVYAGMADGGVWKTTNCCDANTTFTDLTSNPTIATAAVGSITIDPNDHNTIYVGTGEANNGGDNLSSRGVLKSTDAGATWSNLGLSTFDPVGNTTVNPLAIGSFVVDPRNSSKLVVGATGTHNGNTGGLYTSDDAGNTWTGPCALPGAVNSHDVSDVTLDTTANPTAVYVAVGTVFGSTENGIYKGTLSGAGCPTLTLVSSGAPWPTPSSIGRIALGISPSNPNVLYAMVANPIPPGTTLGVFKTTDGGTTWTEPATDASFVDCHGTPIHSNQDWYDLYLTVSPTDPNTFYVGKVDVYKSTDGGATITDLTNVYAAGCLVTGVHPDEHALKFLANNNSFIFGNDGGIWSSADAGVSFTDLNSNFNTLQFYAGDITPNFASDTAPHALGGMQDNGGALYRGELPNPQQWTSTGFGDGFFAAIEPNQKQLAYEDAQHGALYCSTDGGVTLTACAAGWTADSPDFTTPFILDHNHCGTTCQHLILGTFRAWETIDGGTTWNPISGNLVSGTPGPFVGISALAFAPSSGSTLYTGSSDGAVFYSGNVGTGGAATFVNLTGGNAVLPNRPINDVAVDPTTPLVGYAAISGFNQYTPATPGHVYQVVCSAGCATNTWADKSGNLPNVPATAIIVNPINPFQVFIGTEIGFFYTNNIFTASPVWNSFQTGMPVTNIGRLVIDNGNTAMVAFTHGRSAYGIPLPGFPGATPTPSGPTPTPTDTPVAPTPQPTVCANPFVDITSNIFFHAINYLYCNHAVNGTDATHYSPAGTSTRGQFAKVVVLGFGTPAYTPPGQQDFTDVPPGYFAYAFIESGFHAGILNGYDAATCQANNQTPPCYLPNRPITRGQLTKLVVNAANYPAFTPTTPTFSDVLPNNVFYTSIETAHHKGIINGYNDNTFRPNNNIRRDEMAQIVYKGVTTP